MLGDFINRILVLLLGYAYPAFECFKSVEKNRVDIDELRFWCQYWILVALIACFERIGDFIISWLPLYGEMKVIFYVYLWYPKTKGTAYVYGTLLRPYIAEHETEIDRKIMEVRARAWDSFTHHWRNCAQLTQETLAQTFQQIITQSAKFSNQGGKAEKNGRSESGSEPEAESETEATEMKPTKRKLPVLRSLEKQGSKGNKWLPPTPPPTPSRSTTDSPVSSRSRFQTDSVEDFSSLIPDNIPSSPLTDARAKLRRSKPPPA